MRTLMYRETAEACGWDLWCRFGQTVSILIGISCGKKNGFAWNIFYGFELTSLAEEKKNSFRTGFCTWESQRDWSLESHRAFILSGGMPLELFPYSAQGRWPWDWDKERQKCSGAFVVNAMPKYTGNRKIRKSELIGWKGWKRDAFHRRFLPVTLEDMSVFGVKWFILY